MDPDSALHIEPFIDRAEAYLKAHLNTTLTTINQAHDDFELDPILDEAVYVGAAPEPLVIWPSLEIAVPDWTMGDPSLGQERYMLSMQLMVRVFARSAVVGPRAGERLYRSLTRYCQAIIEVMHDPPATLVTGGARGGAIEASRGFYRFNPETNERQELWGGALVIFTVTTDEFNA